jgi:hypothetical protein
MRVGRSATWGFGRDRPSVRSRSSGRPLCGLPSPPGHRQPTGLDVLSLREIEGGSEIPAVSSIACDPMPRIRTWRARSMVRIRRPTLGRPFIRRYRRQ